ncbi:MAG: nuclear transport factor 2 family protein [Myxococcota bacterium]
MSADPEAVVRAYAAAKSRQDVDAALKCCAPDFVLETVPWRLTARGRAETTIDLHTFFELFPDYRFVVERIAVQGNTALAWGRVAMTWTGRLPRGVGPRWLRLRPRAVDLPAVAVFDVADGLLSRERFMFDQRELCRQLGLRPIVMDWIVRRTARHRHAQLGGGVEPITSTQSILIRADPGEVWARSVADVSALLHSRPLPPWLRAERIEVVGGPLQRGSVRRVHLRSGHVTDERVEDYVPGIRLRYRIENGWGPTIDALVAQTWGVHSVEPLEGHARLVWTGHVMPRFRWARPLVRVMTGIIVAVMQRRYLRAMKRQLEGSEAIEGRDPLLVPRGELA